MITRMSIFSRKSPLATNEFRAYWRDIHAPVALKIPALVRYEQNHVVDRMHAGVPPEIGAIDGVCKLWFDNASSMQGVLSGEIVKLLREDEEKFIKNLRTFVVDANIVKSPEAGASIKLLSIVRRDPALDSAAFENAWRSAQAEKLKSIPGVKGYVQNFIKERTAARQAASYEQVPIDCIDELFLGEHVDGSRQISDISQMIWGGNDSARALETFKVEIYAPSPH